MHLNPQFAKAAVYSKAVSGSVVVDSLLILAPIVYVGSVFGLYFVILIFLVLQSSWEERTGCVSLDVFLMYYGC